MGVVVGEEGFNAVGEVVVGQGQVEAVVDGPHGGPDVGQDRTEGLGDRPLAPQRSQHPQRDRAFGLGAGRVHRFQDQVRQVVPPVGLELISFGWLGRLWFVGIVERLVPDELWELFQRVVPEAPSRPQGGGRRRHGDREVLAAIVFVATSGCTWQQLPSASFGPSGATAHRRFAEWTKARVWAKLHRLVLDELGARGELDWTRCAIGSVNMRALKRGT
ncbi:hypothetical protein GCM10028832_02140 [Streptomyces sparsus]